MHLFISTHRTVLRLFLRCGVLVAGVRPVTTVNPGVRNASGDVNVVLGDETLDFAALESTDRFGSQPSLSLSPAYGHRLTTNIP